MDHPILGPIFNFSLKNFECQERQVALACMNDVELEYCMCLLLFECIVIVGWQPFVDKVVIFVCVLRLDLPHMLGVGQELGS